MATSGQIGERGLQTRQRLVEAMLELVNEGGMPVSASVRSIAKRAGVTEAVLYRYFPTKEAMLKEVWDRALAPMVVEKQLLLDSAPSDPAHVLGAWIRITYEHFDRDPAAFHYVFLSEGTATWRDLPGYRVQRNLLRNWLTKELDESAFQSFTIDQALDCFIDVLLGVAKRIRSGDMEGPAVDHCEVTLTAAKRLFGL